MKTLRPTNNPIYRLWNLQFYIASSSLSAHIKYHLPIQFVFFSSIFGQIFGMPFLTSFWTDSPSVFDILGCSKRGPSIRTKEDHKVTPKINTSAAQMGPKEDPILGCLDLKKNPIFSINFWTDLWGATFDLFLGRISLRFRHFGVQQTRPIDPNQGGPKSDPQNQHLKGAN